MSDDPNPAASARYTQFHDQLLARYDEADDLAAQGQFEAALNQFKSCLEFAAAKRMPVYDAELIDIWIRIAFCHADLRRHDEALRCYTGAAALLTDYWDAKNAPEGTDAALRQNRSRDAWSPLIPEGMTFLIRQSFDPRAALATLQQNIAITLFNLDKRPESDTAFQRSLEWYSAIGDLDGQAATWAFWAKCLRSRGEWEPMAKVAASGVRALQSANHERGQVMVGRMLVQALANLNQVAPMVQQLVHVILLGRQIDDPDVAVDVSAFESVAGSLRQFAMQRRQPDILELVVEAERLLQHPRLTEDEQRLAQLRRGAS